MPLYKRAPDSKLCQLIWKIEKTYVFARKMAAVAMYDEYDAPAFLVFIALRLVILIIMIRTLGRTRQNI